MQTKKGKKGTNKVVEEKKEDCIIMAMMMKTMIISYELEICFQIVIRSIH